MASAPCRALVSYSGKPVDRYFNGLLGGNRLDHLQLETAHRYVTHYNHHLPQKALNAQTPAQAIQDWCVRISPGQLLRRPNNRLRRDS